MSVWEFNCLECQNNFIKKKRLSKICPKFCSQDCYKKYESKNNQYVEFKCEMCGAQVRTHRSKQVLAKSFPKFCSMGCRDGGLAGFKWKSATKEEIIKHLSIYFEKHVVKQEGCWGWNGAIDKDGYAILNNKTTKYRRAHRVSWFIKYGNLPKGVAAHTCDKKICTNPLHIFFTDNKGNAQDLKNKGKALKGSENGSSKLTELQVKDIKILLRQGEKLKDICKNYGVHHSTISKIKSGKTWKHVS